MTRSSFFVRGITMMETLTMVVILGIVLFLTLPRLSTAKLSNERAIIKAKALQLNTAKDAFVSIYGVNAAQTKWNNAGSENTRFQLITPYLLGGSSAQPSNLNYTSSGTFFGLRGYVLKFNSEVVTAPVLIYVDADLDGSVGSSELALPYH